MHGQNNTENESTIFDLRLREKCHDVKNRGLSPKSVIFSLTARSAKSYCSHHGQMCSRSVAFRSHHTATKFFRSPYLDTHLSERIYTCTIDTL